MLVSSTTINWYLYISISLSLFISFCLPLCLPLLFDLSVFHFLFLYIPAFQTFLCVCVTFGASPILSFRVSNSFHLPPSSPHFNTATRFPGADSKSRNLFYYFQFPSDHFPIIPTLTLLHLLPPSSSHSFSSSVPPPPPSSSSSSSSFCFSCPLPHPYSASLRLLLHLLLHLPRLLLLLFYFLWAFHISVSKRSFTGICDHKSPQGFRTIHADLNNADTQMVSILLISKSSNLLPSLWGSFQMLQKQLGSPSSSCSIFLLVVRQCLSICMLLLSFFFYSVAGRNGQVY